MISNIKSIQDAPIKKGTKIFVRCDLDVPINNGQIQNTYRLKACLPTLKYILQKEGIPIIAGHMGRPQGKEEPTLTTSILKSFFEKNLNSKNFELLENLRFDSREKEGSEDFAIELASKADLYVNESFATCHREHTSITFIAKKLPSYAGLNLQNEIELLNKVINNPKKPFVSIIGGAKLESKMPTVNKLLTICDQVLLGGKIGLEWEQDLPENLHLPVDYAEENKDIGPKTIDLYKNILNESRTVLWAGPLGLYQNPKFVKGTKEIGNHIVKSTQTKNVFSIVGGGDTITALSDLDLIDKFSFISTGGSALLQFIAEETLPGLEVLK